MRGKCDSAAGCRTFHVYTPTPISSSARRREVGDALAILAAEPERGSGTTLSTKVGPFQTYRYEPPWEPRSWRVAAGRPLLAVAVESGDQFDHCVKRGL